MLRELTAEQVRHRCDPSLFQCNSTAELEPIEGIIGQDRALSALKFGLNIQKPGFNVYVSGLAGTGRTTAIKSFLEVMAAKKETPPDWCYLHNFHDSYCPKAIRVPAGMGLQPVLEINKSHALTKALASKVEGSDEGPFDDIAWLLLDQARILEGEVPEDPAKFTERLNRLVIAGIG